MMQASDFVCETYAFIISTPSHLKNILLKTRFIEWLLKAILLKRKYKLTGFSVTSAKRSQEKEAQCNPVTW